METTSDAFRASGLWQFFSFEGRVRRMTFWINALVCGLATIILSQMFMEVRFSMFTMEERYVISNAPIYYIATIVIIVRTLSVSVRRWHDLDKDGYWAIAYFYPILFSLFPNFIWYTELGNMLVLVGSIVLLVAVGFQGFVPGDDGSNSYGPEPEEEQWF